MKGIVILLKVDEMYSPPQFFGVDIFPYKEIITIFSSNQRSSNPQKHALEVFWKKSVPKIAALK